MNRKSAGTKPLRTSRTNKVEESCCSRVGIGYQIQVPDSFYALSESYKNEQSNREVNTWKPSYSQSDSEMDEYFNKASYYKYSEEAARTFLHYHKYNIARAIIDLPNYQPVLNNWTKNDVKKFLKCVDGRPRKNFVNVKRSFPAYRMGEVAALYYGIAAPFKAVSKHSNKHEKQMQSCYEKAIKHGFIVQTQAPTTIFNTANTTTSANQLENDPLEAELEVYLLNMLSEKQTKRLLHGVKRGRPSSLFVPFSLVDNGEMGKSNGSDSQQLAGSDNSSVYDEDHSYRARVHRSNLPSGIYYNHDEFVDFMQTPLTELAEKRICAVNRMQPLNNELNLHIRKLDNKNQCILDGLENFMPAEGFPKISYRWSRLELALLLTAFSKLGDDFAAVSRTLGTKSESFIRDFYHQFNAQLGLDMIIKARLIKPEEQFKEEFPSNIASGVLEIPDPISPAAALDAATSSCYIPLEVVKQQPLSPSYIPLFPEIKSKVNAEIHENTEGKTRNVEKENNIILEEEKQEIDQDEVIPRVENSELTISATEELEEVHANEHVETTSACEHDFIEEHENSVLEMDEDIEFHEDDDKSFKYESKEDAEKEFQCNVELEEKPEEESEREESQSRPTRFGAKNVEPTEKEEEEEEEPQVRFTRYRRQNVDPLEKEEEIEKEKHQNRSIRHKRSTVEATEKEIEELEQPQAKPIYHRKQNVESRQIEVEEKKPVKRGRPSLTKKFVEPLSLSPKLVVGEVKAKPSRRSTSAERNVESSRALQVLVGKKNETRQRPIKSFEKPYHSAKIAITEEKSKSSPHRPQKTFKIDEKLKTKPGRPSTTSKLKEPHSVKPGRLSKKSSEEVKFRMSISMEQVAMPSRSKKVIESVTPKLKPGRPPKSFTLEDLSLARRSLPSKKMLTKEVVFITKPIRLSKTVLNEEIPKGKPGRPPKSTIDEKQQPVGKRGRPSLTYEQHKQLKEAPSKTKSEKELRKATEAIIETLKRSRRKTQENEVPAKKAKLAPSHPILAKRGRASLDH